MAGNHENCCNYGEDPSKRTLQYRDQQLRAKFRGLPTKESLAHLKKFLYFADIVRINNIPTDAIRLRLFPFSLVDRTLEWLIALQDGGITN
ncbi:hypothetical protein CR513_39959, partial [Mucuna pruriens]